MNVQSKKFKSGRGYKLPEEPTKEILDSIPLTQTEGRIQFKSEEFTSICPITGQPDWAKILILFAPKAYSLETKSLKLYLHSFRNYKGFAEDINIKILNDIFETIYPEKIEVQMNWQKRGGIEIGTIFRREYEPI